MPIPDLSHLQYLVLSCLSNGELSGRELRQLLAREGEKKSGPAFYQLMARMEDAKFVSGSYDQKVVEGQMIKERRYKVTALGMTACEHVRDFYAQRIATAGLQGEGVICG